MLYTRPEIERVVRVPARAAQKRRGKLTSVDKANVLASSRLWRKVTTQVMAREFPDVKLEHQLVDSMAMHLIRWPSAYDVIVAENLFGDILTDEAAMLAGSMRDARRSRTFTAPSRVSSVARAAAKLNHLCASTRSHCFAAPRWCLAQHSIQRTYCTCISSGSSRSASKLGSTMSRS
jgi:hypothetical protein